ncbi:YhdP family protein [Marinivivus vitaminiproducens]|uniref:YhdP family protein n=1 Tax=Marinivivus vitaminiproducens TaxID=3035935 RepID=UPI0027A6F3CB|nr:AsmA-like C-terminal domain-containing protein [Geminicoccaceae bacterium SCSIO 64248]
MIVRSSAVSSTWTAISVPLRIVGHAFSLALQAVCAVLAVAALLLIASAHAPLDLDFLTPRLVEEIKARTDVDLDVRSASLRWQGWRQGMGVGASDLRLRTPEGGTRLALAQVGVALDYRHLLETQDVAPRSVLAEGLRLLLIRDEDGTVALGDLETRTALPSEGDGPDIAAVLQGLFGPPDPRDPLSTVETAGLLGGEVTIVDRASRTDLVVHGIDLHAGRDGQGVSGDLSLNLRQREPDARLQVAFARPFATGETELDMTLDGLELRTFSRALPRLPGFRLHLPIAGTAEARLDPDFKPEAFTFALRAGEGWFQSRTAPGWSMPLADIAVTGGLAADRRRLDISHIQATSGAARVEGSGSLALAAESGPKLDLDVRAAGPIGVGDLAEVWPPDLHGPPRRWVLSHIRSGVASEANLAVRLDAWPQSLGDLPEDAVQGSFRFGDLTLDYKPPLPPVVISSGLARFNGDGITFDLDGTATSAGLTLEKATARLSALAPPKGDERLHVDLTAHGPVAQSLRLLRTPPLNLLRDGPIVPQNLAGRGQANVVIDMPIGDIDPRDIAVTYRASARDVGVERLSEGLALTAGRLDLEGDRTRLTLGGNARLNGILATIDGTVDLPEGRPPRGRYRIRSELTELERSSLKWPDVPKVTGPVGIDATLTQLPAEPGFQVAVSADLTRARVQLEPVGLDKAAGRRAVLQVDARLVEGGALPAPTFRLEGTAMSGSGRAVLANDPPRVTRLQIDNATFDQNRASVIVNLPQQRIVDVLIRADRLVLDPFVNRVMQAAPQDREEPLERLTIDLTADSTGLSGHPPLTTVDGRFIQSNGLWQELTFSARLPGGGDLRLRRLADARGPQLRIDATDTGALIRAATGTETIRGGRSRLIIGYDPKTLKPDGPGTFVTRGFTIRGAPLLAQLLSLASLSGIVNTLSGEGIAFDRLNLGFTISDKRIDITEGRLRGSQIGLYANGIVDLGVARAFNLRGTLIPVRGLNAFLGNIPILGTLLTGRDREGVFGMTYTVTGPIERPTIQVNPLSALAPGLLRDLFSGLGDGSLEPPPPYEYDRTTP